MLLAIDIGNTNTVLGVFQGSNIIFEARLKTEKGSSAVGMLLAIKRREAAVLFEFEPLKIKVELNSSKPESVCDKPARVA